MYGILQVNGLATVLGIVAGLQDCPSRLVTTGTTSPSPSLILALVARSAPAESEAVVAFRRVDDKLKYFGPSAGGLGLAEVWNVGVYFVTVFGEGRTELFGRQDPKVGRRDK
jgi:hypothetical protein